MNRGVGVWERGQEELVHFEKVWSLGKGRLKGDAPGKKAESTTVSGKTLHYRIYSKGFIKETEDWTQSEGP